jgi:hypothetical protein
MGAPAAVAELVRRFADQTATYHAAPYNEAQVRVEFIDPLFTALGWDVANRKGRSLIYREVVHEDSLDVHGSKKAPDYSFRIGGDRKFFVEAKKPAVNVGVDPGPAFQVRRYAWSAKLPVSVVTDFEELSVYDCRQEPKPDDDAAVARLVHLSFTDFDTRWDDLAALLSYEAVRDGALEQFAASIRVRRGTTEVDSIFLGELERWRSTLAHDLAAHNPALTQRHLNYAVQQTIDRIVFLRIAEDRGIEPYGQLRALVDAGEVYAGLRTLFHRADERYNSGLFHFRTEAERPEAPDTLTLTLTISSGVLSAILRRLYYPESPYEFSVLPAAILGQVYEQFLGRVIHLDAGHKATVEEKPEVRKAGGVYYTPTPIVDFIVSATLGPLLDGRAVAEIAGEGRARGRHPLRVLDPACGSGTFLLGAYEYLLRWYHEAYASDDPEKWARGRSPRLRLGRSGDWELTTTERKQILLRHIYGVDIDTQAVEVTKLSLLLKVLEGETAEDLASQLALFRERALPDLAHNIKCGNSLIESDYYANQQMALLDTDTRLEINVFDWASEFSEAHADEGFDAIIGNPPYLDSETMTEFTPTWRPYCVGKYTAASGNWDVFCVFIERSLALCRPGGRHSFIVPNKLGSANYASSIRALLAGHHALERVRDFASIAVFPVAVYPIVYVAAKGTRDDSQPVLYERMVELDGGPATVGREERLDRQRYFPSEGAPWPIFADIDAHSPVQRLQATFEPLSKSADVHGAATVADAYKMAPLIADGGSDETGAWRIVNSGTIDRYTVLWGYRRMRYLGQSFLRPTLGRDAEFSATRLRQADTPKIIIAGMTRRLECVVDVDGALLAAKSTTVIEGAEADLRWLVGILNSRLISFYYLSVFGGDRLQGGYLRIGPPQVRTLPVPEFDVRLASHARMIEYVQQLCELHQRRLEAGTPHEKAVYARQAAVVDAQIDEAVYDIYDLTADERRAVENSLEPLGG